MSDWHTNLSFKRTDQENTAFSEIGQTWKYAWKTHTPEENTKMLYGTDDWPNEKICTSSYNDKYLILFSERYPKHSRDYSDNGIYVELVGIIQNSDLIPLCVCVYDWSHCSCYEWDDGMSSPNKIYRFSGYVSEMKAQARMRPNSYLLTTPLETSIDNSDDDDELYGFREIMRFYDRYIKMNLDKQVHLEKLLEVNTQIEYSPPSNLIKDGGILYQQTKSDFDSKL